MKRMAKVKRIAQTLWMKRKNRKEVHSVSTGDIAAAVKLKGYTYE